MKSITHRELRNNSAEVLRSVEAGESYLVTNRGATVANLVPARAAAGLPVAKAAVRRYVPGEGARVRLNEPVQRILDELREER